MRFLIVAVLVLGGCGPSTVTECKAHCESKGLTVHFFSERKCFPDIGGKCNRCVCEPFVGAGPIQCGEEPKP